MSFLILAEITAVTIAEPTIEYRVGTDLQYFMAGMALTLLLGHTPNMDIVLIL